MRYMQKCILSKRMTVHFPVLCRFVPQVSAENIHVKLISCSCSLLKKYTVWLVAMKIVVLKICVCKVTIHRNIKSTVYPSEL